jgi:hypothetical protein
MIEPMCRRRRTAEILASSAKSAGRDGERSEASGEDDQRAGTVSAGARRLATRMAIEGSSMGTIASQLHPEFGIEDPTAILREADL